MNTHISAPFHLFLLILSAVLFLLATVLWPTQVDQPYRNRLAYAGLFCWCVSTFVSG